MGVGVGASNIHSSKRYVRCDIYWGFVGDFEKNMFNLQSVLPSADDMALLATNPFSGTVMINRGPRMYKIVCPLLVSFLQKTLEMLYDNNHF